MSYAFTQGDINKVCELHSILLDECISLTKLHREMSNKEFSANISRLERLTTIANRQINSMVKTSKIQYQKEVSDDEIEEKFVDVQINARSLVRKYGLVLLLPNNPNDDQKAIFSMVENENKYENIDFEFFCEKVHEGEYSIKKYLQYVDGKLDMANCKIDAIFDNEEDEKNFPNKLRESLKIYQQIRDVLNFDLFPCSQYLVDHGIMKEKHEKDYIKSYTKQKVFTQDYDPKNPPPDWFIKKITN